MSEVYELIEGLESVKLKIAEIAVRKSAPIIIGVAGGSGSGKTTKVARKIEEMFPGAKILSMDDYYRGQEFMTSIGSCNWDEPRVYDLDLLKRHLQELKTGAFIRKPIYSFAGAKRLGFTPFKADHYLIIEGLFALYPEIAEELDLKIFVDIAVHGSLIRRILRDVERTGQTEEQILEQYVTTVYPMFKRYIEPTKFSADIVIINEYAPEIETENCGTREIQIKAVPPEKVMDDRLKNLGFAKSGAVFQQDTYFLAPNWPKDYCDEMMRIREENGRFFLAYKGPQGSGSFRIKPKIEFEVKPLLKDALKRLGYQEIISFGKRREMFSNRMIEVAIDEFTNGCHFMEFRTSNPKGESEIFKYLERLGVNPRAVTQNSYLEIMLGLNKR